MSDPEIERIMLLSFCNEEEARQAFAKTNDVIDAVDMIINIPMSLGAPKQKTMTDEQAAFSKIRKDMEARDRLLETNLTRSNQSDSSSQELPHTHAPVQEEMSLHSDCTQHSQIPTLAEEEQKPETVCQ